MGINMCSKEEVREVIHSEVTPLWMRRVLGGVVTLAVLFVGWLAYETHMQDEARVKQDASIARQLSEAQVAHTKANSEILAKIDNIRFAFATANAETMGRTDRLTDQITYIKELAVTRSKDRYTGKQAVARQLLVDERCKTVDRRLKEIEDAIEKLHKNVNL